jgi:hypothetical protein
LVLANLNASTTSFLPNQKSPWIVVKFCTSGVDPFPSPETQGKEAILAKWIRVKEQAQNILVAGATMEPNKLSRWAHEVGQA